MKTLTTVLVTLGGAAVAVAVGAAAFAWSGLYNIAANVQHTQGVYTLLEVVGQRSIRLRASAIETPPLDAPELVQIGAACYRAKCVQCHGGPGYAPAEIGRSMQPVPGPLVNADERYRPRELFWIVENGIKMSGMPAWGHRLDKKEMWSVVAFLGQLPRLNAPQFAAAMQQPEALCREPGSSVRADAEPNVRRGRDALIQYGCNACHVIPGVTGTSVHVGPPLAGIGGRGLIAGKLANTPEAMARWIRDPGEVDPGTSMPDLDVSEADARDIAAFLSTLH